MEAGNEMEKNNVNTVDDVQARLAEELQISIAEKVRTDSEDLVQLTSVDSLHGLRPDIELEYIQNNLAEMAKNSEYNDIQSVTAPNGVVFLYSTMFITKQYAHILARIESKNSSIIIAATVRDDSRIYPRLTRVEYFMMPPFSIKPDELEVHINRIPESEEYKDIKLLIASTGARYLYSDLYIDDKYAKTMAEWEEVEQFENP